MNVTLDGIAPGKWRNLTEKEMADIHKLVSTSTKTEEGSLLKGESLEDQSE
jgi:23S rRNA pseudouridine2604 synthase